MWNYYSYYPFGKKTTFSVGGRANEIFSGQNVHAHHNNYTPHKGFGSGGNTITKYQERAIQNGDALTSLPLKTHHNPPYIEMVWNYPGAPAGKTRLIVNSNNLDEIYFTDDHYNVYWKVYAAQNTHTVFPS